LILLQLVNNAPKWVVSFAGLGGQDGSEYAAKDTWLDKLLWEVPVF